MSDVLSRYRKTYHTFRFLILDTPNLPRKHIGSFESKMASLELIYRKVLSKAGELRNVVKEETSEDKIFLERTTQALMQATTFFEAYLYFYWSLLDIIAKCIPHFYDPSKNNIPVDFGCQRSFFVYEKPGFDPEYTNFLNENEEWYKTLRNNRHAVTHRVSAFLGFGDNYEVIFQDLPKKDAKKVSNVFKKKTFENLEMYLEESFSKLLKLLEFYVEHYKKRIPESKKTKIWKKAL